MYLSGYGACVNVRTSSMNLARLTIGPMLAKSIQTGELLPPEAAEVRSARALTPSLQSGPRPARRLRRRRPTPSRLPGRTSPRIACPPFDAAPRPASHALLSTRQVVRLLKLYYFLAAEHLQQHAPLTIALTPSLTLTMTLTLTLTTDPYPGPNQALLGRQRLLGVVPADRLLLRDR